MVGFHGNAVTGFVRPYSSLYRYFLFTVRLASTRLAKFLLQMKQTFCSEKFQYNKPSLIRISEAKVSPKRQKQNLEYK
jgi:hypothetical protein